METKTFDHRYVYNDENGKYWDILQLQTVMLFFFGHRDGAALYPSPKVSKISESFVIPQWKR